MRIKSGKISEGNKKQKNRLREDEKRRQILLDEALVKELQDEEEWKHKRQIGCVMEETDTQKKTQAGGKGETTCRGI